MKPSKVKIISVFCLVFVLIISAIFYLIWPKYANRLNVILIVIDPLRADHLSCYGYNRSTSPNLDKFAKEGVLFTQALSQSSGTRVSGLSMLTSLYPAVYKMLRADAPLAKEFITLPEILKKYGYLNIIFGGGGPLPYFSNLCARFDLYEINDLGEGANKFFVRKGDYSPAFWINKKVINSLRQYRNRKFFFFVNYLDTHAPYISSYPYNKIFWQEKTTKEAEYFVKNFSGKSEDFEASNTKKEIFNYAFSQYDGQIRYIDEQIKTLLDELEKLGLSKNTLVIVASDHGEELKDHGGFFHEKTLYDEMIRVPLMMRLPGVISQGKIIPDLVRNIDLVPTILDILKIRSGNIMQGVSLMPLINKGISLNLDAFAETGHRGKHLRAIRKVEVKLIEERDVLTNLCSYKLYNLKSDPKELNNLIEKSPKEAESLKAELKDYTLSGEKIRKLILEGSLFYQGKLEKSRLN